MTAVAESLLRSTGSASWSGSGGASGSCFGLSAMARRPFLSAAWICLVRRSTSTTWPGLSFSPASGITRTPGRMFLIRFISRHLLRLRNQFDLGHDVRAGNALADFGPHQPAGLEAGLLIDGLRLQVFAHRHLSDLFIRDDDDLVQRHGGGQQNAAGAVVLDDPLLAQLELGL